MGAITTLAMTLKQGDRVLLADDVYGGTYRLFARVLGDLGISFERVDMTDLAAVERALEPGAAMVLAETPTNPLLKILDLAALAELARGVGAHLTVDNTFATPFIQRPLELGADSVIYSATKYLGGHSDLVMGSISTNDDALGDRLQFLRNAVGTVPGPFDSWLLLRGLKTLAIRMRVHSTNAAAIAAWLKEQPGVERVHYPGDPSFDGYEVATRQMAAAGDPLYGGMISIDVGDEARALEVCSKTKLFWLAESLGGVESLIEHPGRMTHASLAGSGAEIAPGLIRLSVGIEHVEDLIADLDQALA